MIGSADGKAGSDRR